MLNKIIKRSFNTKVSQSVINLNSTLSRDEYIGIVDEDDNFTGEVMTRYEMR